MRGSLRPSFLMSNYDRTNNLLRIAIWEGVTCGIRKASFQEDITKEAVVDTVVDEVLNSLDLYFDFENAEHPD
jgi:hypothetical protein